MSSQEIMVNTSAAERKVQLPGRLERLHASESRNAGPVNCNGLLDGSLSQQLKRALTCLDKLFTFVFRGHSLVILLIDHRLLVIEFT